MTPGFIDTHCHFDFPPFAGHEKASLAQAKACGVQKIIVPAIGVQHFSRIQAVVLRHEMLYAALGLHPIVIEQHDEHSLIALEQALAARCDKVVAIGEAGLDLYRADPQFDRQCALLIEQLQLAARFELPIILHSRRTHDRLAMLLRRHPVARTGVIHGFAGSLQQAERFVGLGYAIGVGGTITYPRASKTRAAIAALPLDSLLLETDAPDMPVNGFQGQPNRPERITAVFRSLCQLRPEPEQLIAQALWRNSQRIFALPA